MVRTLGMIFVALVILVEDTSGMNSGFELRIIFFPDFIAVITIMNQRVQQSGTTESLIINRKLIKMCIRDRPKGVPDVTANTRPLTGRVFTFFFIGLAGLAAVTVSVAASS